VSKALFIYFLISNPYLMNKSILLFSIVFLLSQNEVIACGCNVERPFLETSIDAALIAVVEIQNHTTYDEMMGEDVPVSMSVKIKKVLKGVETQSEITVWGNNGLMCSPYLSIFEVGSEWVMAFREAPIEAYENAKKTDYGLSNCGEHFMKMKKGVIRGLIKSKRNYQSMTIGTLKANLDIINREKGKIDIEKCRYIAQLYDLGVDTVGIFEAYQKDAAIYKMELKTGLEMSVDDDFPNYCSYIKGASVNRQVFIYWQFKGKTYVKQIDNMFEYDAVEMNDVAFFDVYFEYKSRFKKERLELPNKKSKSTSSRLQGNTPKIRIQKVGYNLPPQNPQNPHENYLLQSIQVFIDGAVFLRDFDARLFDKTYNPKFYKQNQETSIHDFLTILTDETKGLVKQNEQSFKMFQQFKRLYSVR
jgi:hypothetical protein